MKKSSIIRSILFLILFVGFSNTCVQAAENILQDSLAISQQFESHQQTLLEQSPESFLKTNWIALLFGILGFAELVARLTPSEKDNTVVSFINAVLNTFIPNLKKGGGKFE